MPESGDKSPLTKPPAAAWDPAPIVVTDSSLQTEAIGKLEQSFAYCIFVGPRGLRAGWSLVVFVGILMVLAVPEQLIMAGVFHPGGHSVQRPSTMIVGEGLSLLLVMLATLVMAKIEGRPLLSYGLSGDRKLPRFAWGVSIGMAALSTLIAVLKLAGLLVFDGLLLHGLPAWQYGFEWGVAFLLVALFEESLLRGYVQFTLARGIGFWWAAIVLSASFGLLHLNNQDESRVGIFSAAAIGLVCCLSLWLTKSLWWAVGLHAGWDWAQSYFYGVADSGVTVVGHLYASHPVGALIWSGGATGPEGSIYVLPVILVVGAGVWIAMRPKASGTMPEDPADETPAA